MADDGESVTLESCIVSNVAVIGAGLGGLSAAIRLAASGVGVTVFEKNERVGGKMDVWCEGGYTFDTGPSLLTMPFVVRELFESVGRDAGSYLDLVPVDPICRYFYPDGVRLDAWSDPGRMRSELERLAPADLDGFERFLRHGEQIYSAAAGPFLFSGFGSWSAAELARNVRHIPALAKIDAFRSLSSAVDAFVTDTHLRQLLKRFATYNGSSPYLAPATLAIIPYVEFRMGGWYVRKGMYDLARALGRLAMEFGVEIRTGTEVQQITLKGSTVTGVRLKDGSRREVDAVVCNADALYATRTLLGDGSASSRRWPTGKKLSMAGFVLLLGVRRSFPELLQHNIFFSKDYREEFDRLVGEQLPADDPTIYVALSCKSDTSHAPETGSNLFVLVNAPPVTDTFDWNKEGIAYRNRVVEKLSRAGLGDFNSAIEVERMITPAEFQRRYNAYGGSIYGLSSNGRMAAFSRPPNKSQSHRGLYFVGGSSHPGGGIPLVLLSGKIVAEMAKRDLRL